MTAIDDHVRAFEPDHLLIALRSPEHAAWQERGLIDRIEQRFGLPMRTERGRSPAISGTARPSTSTASGPNKRARSMLRS